MRTAGLIALAVLLPFTAYAALVNINTADATLLDTLPGIGPSKAAAIVDFRTQNGPFAVIEDIQKVSGIGPVTFANMKAQITVGIVAAPAGGWPASGGQPQANTAGSNKVQVVEPPITSAKNIQAHEEAVRAPAGATELAPAGAALPPPASNARAAGLFSSIWTLGLLGVILLAGGAFIFL